MIQRQSGTPLIAEEKLHIGNEPGKSVEPERADGQQAVKKFVYLHGGDIRGAAEASGRNAAELLDFSANINPLGMPPGVREAIIESLDSSLNYPDPFCRGLRRALSEKLGQPEKYILCGNGGAELIYRLVYAARPKRALVTAPAFAEYEEAMNQTGTGIDFFPLGKTLEITEDYVDKLSPEHDIVFLCNPNNPTGILTPRGVVKKLLDKAKALDVRVCLDECFLDFVKNEEEYSAAGWLAEYPNLIILKSFTKMYAIPGLRLGYVLSADADLLNRMRLAGQPWSVSEPAQAAGIATLKAGGFREKTIALVNAERSFLKEQLEELGLCVYDGRANYLCFQAEGDTTLADRMQAEGILIRRCANYHGLGPDFYRTAVRGHEENEKLLAALKKVL